MSKLLEAIYQNGSLILDEKLPDSMEGKKVKIVLLEVDDTERRKENFLKLAARHSFTLPDDYKFNRIAGALSALLNRDKEHTFKLKCVFFCHQNTQGELKLYFPRPLGFVGPKPLIPLDWQKDLALNHALWDKSKPCPLGKFKPKDENKNLESEDEENDKKYRQYLPYDLEGEGHRVILTRCEQLDEQWRTLESLSNKNFKKGGKVIAYLITPGVFERLHNGQAMCRPWPWEWKFAHTVNSNQTQGNLVSVATERAVPISCRIRDENDSNKSIPAPQVFAAPPGSQYYLENSQVLFQDSAEATDKAKRWRELGYSELLWISYKE